MLPVPLPAPPTVGVPGFGGPWLCSTPPPAWRRAAAGRVAAGKRVARSGCCGAGRASSSPPQGPRAGPGRVLVPRLVQRTTCTCLQLDRRPLPSLRPSSRWIRAPKAARQDAGPAPRPLGPLSGLPPALSPCCRTGSAPRAGTAALLLLGRVCSSRLGRTRSKARRSSGRASLRSPAPVQRAEPCPAAADPGGCLPSRCSPLGDDLAPLAPGSAVALGLPGCPAAPRYWPWQRGGKGNGCVGRNSVLCAATGPLSRRAAPSCPAPQGVSAALLRGGTDAGAGCPGPAACGRLSLQSS